MIELYENNESFVEIQNQEGKKQTFICHICEETFEHYAFEAHFPICAKQKPECELCNESFPSIKNSPRLILNFRL